jgi:hypothetical protein
MMSGILNISARSLPCLPSALFEIHLGVTPEKLEGIEEPAIGKEATSTTPGGRDSGPSWYEAQDLQTLKAWNNEVSSIQPEISLFGSLKNIDVCASDSHWRRSNFTIRHHTQCSFT